MKKTALLLIFFFLFAKVYSQSISIDSLMYPDRFISRNLPILTDKELLKIASMPDLPLPANYKTLVKASLPYKIDNSTQPYMIPITWQSGYECGQSGSIAFVFTYEMDRLRGVPASSDANKYVTHFAWNFMNSGYNYTGVSYYDTWEIIRYCGTPNIPDYGGSLNYGGEKRWMSGYNSYYNAMKNRLFTGYNLQVGTPEGLMVLKNWLANHLEGSSVGGLANFYAQYGSPNATLPAGTEEGGKALMSTWGGSPSHTWTIVGYNDSIRYDFNSDGQYTNNIDINGDGVVDMHDWEKGGLKFANGYSGTGWGNGGYSYMMYKALADNIGSGGIWNNRVSVQYPKQTYAPLLTMKVQLKHTCRNRIKVMAGVATNTAATKPEYTIEFPVFNFQGGKYYMQGDTTQAAKTIEFGLDVSRLLNYVSPGQNAKYFLQVIERDTNSESAGEIVSYALMDYTSGLVQTNCTSTNVNINNNDTTRLSVTRAVNYSQVVITTNALTDAVVNHPYSQQLTAASGTPDYHWDFDYSFNTNEPVSTYPNTSVVPLSANSQGYAIQNLSFDFPFYGEKINKLYISPDGYIKFDNQLFTWPYLISKDQLFKSTKIIAPFYVDLSFGTGGGFWFEGNSQWAVIRWKAIINGQSSTNVNVAVKLYANGVIEFYYENISVPVNTAFVSAVSRGNNRDFCFTPYSGKLFTNTAVKCFTFTPQQIPDGLTISPSGLLSGTIQQEFNASPLSFAVIDNNDIIAKKTLPFSSSGITVSYTVNAGTDSIINAGEQVSLSLKVKNIGNAAFTNAQLRLRSNDAHIAITDSTDAYASIPANDSVAIPNAFVFTVDSIISDNYIIPATIKVFNATDTFSYATTFHVRSTILDIGNVAVFDGNNNLPEPGENVVIAVQIKNPGEIKAFDVDALLNTADNFATISTDSSHFASISGGDSATAYFITQIDPAVDDGHVIIFNVCLKAQGGYKINKFFAVQIGGNAEDFETNDFTSYPWTSNGDSVWFTTTQLPYEGSYCSESGNISENQESRITLTMNVLDAGKISFYRKVSCEAHPGYTDYDYLAFYIDNVEKGRWDGITAWERFEYPVTSGTHTFKWVYHKDYSVSSGEDCAWLDYVVFPVSAGLADSLSYTPHVINKNLPQNSIAFENINISNLDAPGVLLYSCDVDGFSSNGNNTWLTPELQYGSVGAASTDPLKLLFNTNGLALDTYNAMVHLTFNFTDTVSIPVTLTVYSDATINEESADEIHLNVYPNPTTDKVYLNFTTKETSDVVLHIFDVQGRLVNRIEQKNMNAGKQTISWDARDAGQHRCADGIYLFRLLVNDKEYHGRIVLTGK